MHSLLYDVVCLAKLPNLRCPKVVSVFRMSSAASIEITSFTLLKHDGNLPHIRHT